MSLEAISPSDVLTRPLYTASLSQVAGLSGQKHFMFSPNHPTYVLHPELADQAFANVGGSCIPSKRFFQRNDEEKKWVNELRKDDDKWYKHLEREAEYQQQLHNNLY